METPSSTATLTTTERNEVLLTLLTLANEAAKRFGISFSLPFDNDPSTPERVLVWSIFIHIQTAFQAITNETQQSKLKEDFRRLQFNVEREILSNDILACQRIKDALTLIRKHLLTKELSEEVNFFLRVLSNKKPLEPLRKEILKQYEEGNPPWSNPDMEELYKGNDNTEQYNYNIGGLPRQGSTAEK